MNRKILFECTWILFSLIGCLALSAFVLHNADNAYLYLAIIWIALPLALIRVTKSGKFRVIFINISVLTALLFVLEIGLRLTSNTCRHLDINRDDTKSNIEFTSIKGYQLAADKTLKVRKSREGETVFDVSYSTDKNGLRITPNGSSDSILVFGASYAFGTGVNDDETMPYELGSLTGKKVYNFGYTGYGAHQMLSIIENGLHHLPTNPSPKHAIYLAIPDHVRRTAGFSDWDWNSPKYERDANGRLRNAGPFYKYSIFSPLKYTVLALQRKSYLISGLSTKQSHMQDANLRLYLAVVKQSSDLLKTKYPGLQFHIVLWKTSECGDQKNDFEYDKMRSALKAEGFTIHEIQNILPDYCQNYWSYRIHQCENHPTANAHRLLANYLSERVINRN